MSISDSDKDKDPEITDSVSDDSDGGAGESDGGSAGSGSSESSPNTSKPSSTAEAESKESDTDAESAVVKKKKGKAKKVVSEGIVHIRATFNNTIITITTLSGDVLCQKTAGGVGFKGSRKGTPFAAQQAAEFAVKQAIDNFHMKRASIYISGAGGGRDSAMKAVRSAGLEVVCLKEMTRIPHNGCRPPKKRRV